MKFKIPTAIRGHALAFLRFCTVLFGIAMLIACPHEPSRFPVLPGELRIYPGTEVTVNTTVTAEYIPKYTGTYTEQVSYQWSAAGKEIPGATDTVFVPETPGLYTITVSAFWYESISKTITATSSGNELVGALHISPESGAITGDALTAEYSGSEAVSYQWYKDTVALAGAENRTFIPIIEGAYSVAVSADGYGSKQSGAVIVSSPNGALPGVVVLDLAVNSAGDILSVQYTGIEGVVYQWYWNNILVPGATGETYSPSKTGSYHVAINKRGYNSIVSEPVSVANARNPGSNADLLSLATDRGAITLVVGTFKYTQTVSNAVSSITVSALPEDPYAAIALDPAVTPIPLIVGENTITITVTAEDGSAEKTYTLVVTRLAAVSSNAWLAELLVAGITVDVSAGPGNYAVTIPYASTLSAVVYAVPLEAGASYAPAQMTSLVVGLNSLVITVTAVNGLTAEYRVAVTMEPRPEDLAITLNGSFGQTIDLTKDPQNDLVKSHNDVLTVTPPANLTSYDTHEWYLDGEYAMSYEKPNGDYEVNASQFSTYGTHSLMLAAWKDGKVYSATVTFRVVP